jgi:hypothetical protein
MTTPEERRVIRLDDRDGRTMLNTIGHKAIGGCGAPIHRRRLL